MATTLTAYDKPTTLLENQYTRLGYTFIGWGSKEYYGINPENNQLVWF